VPRRLGPDEEAVWSRVAATVRPLKGRARVKSPPAPRVAAAIAPTPPEPPRVSRQALARPVDGSTLDGGWDRRLRGGKLVPDRSIDLHGCSRDQAYAILSRAIEDAALAEQRTLLVVTGKGGRGGDDGERPRGVIRASLPHWLETPALRPYVAALRPAHPRHGGSGAFYVILRRRR
jgi:DNA-nicking Smr family endonuclease